MKLKVHKIALALFTLAPMFCFAEKNEVLASQHYEESYSVSKGAELNVDASFSSFSIEIWDKNEVLIIGDINIEANNQKKADKLLENFKVQMGKSGNSVTVEVGLQGNNSWDNNGSTEMEVEFVIMAPEWIMLDADISFGDLDISELKNADISVEYGELHANFLSGSDTEVDIAFSSASIGELNGGTVDNSYGEVNIGILSGDLELENGYGTATIQTLTADVKNLEVDNSFGETTIKVPSSLTFDVSTESSFGDVKISGSWNEKMKDKDFQEEETKGTLGNGSPTGTIEVECSFGDVKIKQG